MTVLREIKQIDFFVGQTFETSVDHEKIQSGSLLELLIFLVVDFGTSALFIISYGTVDASLIAYSWQLSILNHINRLNLFQILIFVRAVQQRMEKIKRSFQLYREMEQQIIKTRFMQIVLIRLYEVNQVINRTFGTSLFISMLLIYASLMIDSYWMTTVIIEKKFNEQDESRKN